MQTFIDADGNEYPVSDATPITFPDGWTSDEMRQATARWSGGVPLSAREAAWLKAQTNRNNLQRVVAFLAGRDFRDVGPTLDCVHGQRWTPDTCGCVHDEVFDNFAPQGEAVAHRSHKHCQHHAGLKDPAAHHAEVKAENAHKNKALREVADALGVEIGEVEWSHDSQRRLVVKHAKLKGADKTKAAAALTNLGRDTQLIE